MSANGPGDDAVYEMFWDCKYCGQKKLLGLTHRFCAACGAPQDPAARYFPPDHEKVPVHAHPFVGADVACPACKQPMSRAATCCTHCGGPLHQGGEVARKGDVVVSPPGFVVSAAPETKKETKRKTPVWLFATLGCSAGLVVLLILVAVFWRREGVFAVTGHAWTRSIAVERYVARNKSVWCEDKPAGARELSRRREQRGTIKERDGEVCVTRKKDLGNGTFKEARECQPKYKDVPAMADKCGVEVTEWTTERTLTENGESPTDPPRWPKISLARTGTCIGCEREGRRSETYAVTFADTKSGKEATCELPEARWSTLTRGSKWKGTARVMTGGLDCDGLVRQ